MPSQDVTPHLQTALRARPTGAVDPTTHRLVFLIEAPDGTPLQLIRSARSPEEALAIYARALQITASGQD